MISINRVIYAIIFALPVGFGRILFESCSAGSVQAALLVGGGDYTDGQQASNDFTTAISSSDIDGLNYVSSSATINGF